MRCPPFNFLPTVDNSSGNCRDRSNDQNCLELNGGNHSKAHWWPQPLFNISSFSDHHCQGVVSNSLAGALRHNLVTRSTWGVTVSNLTAAFSPRSASHQLVTRVNRVIASSATISSSREFLLRGMFPELSAYLLSISCACFQMFTR